MPDAADRLLPVTSPCSGPGLQSPSMDRLSSFPMLMAVSVVLLTLAGASAIDRQWSPAE